MRSRPLVAALALAFTLGGCMAPGRRSPQRIELDAAAPEIPLAMDGPGAIVEARIDGHGPYRLVFDTGTDMTVLAPRVAAEIGAPTRDRHVLVQGVHASTFDRFAIARLREIDLGGVRLHDLDALVAEPPAACDGLIGLQQFGDLRVSIDFARGRLTVREGPHDADASATVMPLDRRGGVPVVEIRLGAASVRALVDSGFDGTIYLDGETVPGVALEEPPLALARSTSFGGDTETLAFARLAHSWSWAGLTFERPIIAFGGGRPLVGMEVLRHFRIDVDPAARTMRWAPQAAAPVTTAPLVGPGIIVRKTDDGDATVDLVVPGSAAARADVRPGDQVLSATTVVVHGDAATPRLRLRLARDGAIRDVEIPYERFLP